MCAIDDGEPWVFHRESHPAARKPYRCYDCGRDIEPGERHLYVVGKTYDGLGTFRVCAHCEAAATWLQITCGGYLLGGIGEELREHWDEEWDLRSVLLGRLIIGHGNRWREGTRGRRWSTARLMPIPDVAAIKASIPALAHA